MYSIGILLHVGLSFFPGLIVLTLFFSSVLAGGTTKRTYYGRAFVVSFSGLAIAAIFALLSPFIIADVPLMDAGIMGAFAVWVLLLKRYLGTGWLESLPPAFMAAVVYVVIIALASGFTMLLLAD